MAAALDILGDGRCLLHVGDVLERLAAMAPDSVDCVVTSPPYWGLRDYGVAGQIGLEPTLAEHLDVMVAVFDAVRRVLKPTGTLWLNYGDCYATAPNGRSAADTKATGTDDRTFRDKPFSTVGPIYVDAYEKTSRVGSGGNNGSLAAAHGGRVVSGGYLKPKDLCMIPNRLAIALQDAGWWVRSEIVWGKSNPMPDSSGTARPATAHEKIFLLTKSGDGGVWRARDTGEISFAPDLAERCPLVTRPDADGPRWMRLGAYYDADKVRVAPAASSFARWSQDLDGQAGSTRANGGAKTNGPMKAVGGPRDKKRAADVASPRHAGGNQSHESRCDTARRGALAAELRAGGRRGGPARRRSRGLAHGDHAFRRGAFRDLPAGACRPVRPRRLPERRPGARPVRRCRHHRACGAAPDAAGRADRAQSRICGHGSRADPPRLDGRGRAQARDRQGAR